MASTSKARVFFTFFVLVQIRRHTHTQSNKGVIGIDFICQLLRRDKGGSIYKMNQVENLLRNLPERIRRSRILKKQKIASVTTTKMMRITTNILCVSFG